MADVLGIKVGLKDPGQTENKLDFDKIFKETLVSPSEKIKPPEVAKAQEIDGEDIIIATLGNFSLISGKAKAGKSFLMTILSSLIISTKVFGKLKNKLPLNKEKVLYFDTEQGRYHVQLLVKRICKLAQCYDPENLKVHMLRSYSANEMLQIIEKRIYETPGLGVVIIDGIKDLVSAINDEEQATMISRKLLKWTEELNIHIYVVLHQNKTDNNARGHLGTELVNKAETYLTVSKSEGDKDISIVEASVCRNKNLESFAFEIIDNMPVEAENLEVRTSTRKNSFNIEKIEDFKKMEMLNTIYSKGTDEFTYKDLTFQLKKVFKDMYFNNSDRKLSDHKCRDLINECRYKDWIVQERTKGPYRIGNYNNE